MKPQTLIWKLFSVKKDELGFTFPLLLLYFLSGSFFTIGQIFTETLFLQIYGAEGLAKFFIYNGIALISGGILYNLFIQRFSNHRGYIFLILLFSLLIGGGAILKNNNYSWLPLLLYIGNYLFTFFLDLHFFNFADTFMTIRNSKRILPFLLGGGKLGGIIASIMIFSVLAHKISAYGIYYWAANGIALLLPVFFLTKQNRLKGKIKTIKSYELMPDFSILEKLLTKIRISQSIPIFSYSVAAIFVMSVINQISEYYFASVFVAVFPDSGDLASFLSIYTFFTDILTLLLQLFLISRMIERIGVRKSNYIYPGSFLFFLLIYALFPVLISGIMLRFFRKNLSIMVRTPVFNIIMASAPRNRMPEVKSFIQGIINPIGMITGGLAIRIIFSSLSTGQGYLLSITAGLLYLVLTYFQNRAFKKSLEQRIMMDRFSRHADLPSNEIIYDSLYPEMDKNLHLMEALFLRNPSAALAGKLLRDFHNLSFNTKEFLIELTTTEKWEFSGDIVSSAMKDDNPVIRAKGLAAVKYLPPPVQDDTIKKNFSPTNQTEDLALSIVMDSGKTVGLEISIEIKILSAMDAMKLRILDGDNLYDDFLSVIQVLSPDYYLPYLAEIVSKTDSLQAFKEITPHAGRLQRNQARRALFHHKNAPMEYILNFTRSASTLEEIDKLFILDHRKFLSRENITQLYRYDEKALSFVLGRLLKPKSYYQKFNYLNYLLGVNIRNRKLITGFFEYEIDTILRYKKTADFLQREKTGGKKESVFIEFFLILFEDLIKLHKHLMLKSLAIYIGIDIDEIFESNLLLNDRDLNNYILEYLETSGKIGKQSLKILEDDVSPQYQDPLPGQHKPEEIVGALSAKLRYFLPEVYQPVLYCLTIMQKKTPYKHPDKIKRREEHEMNDLIEKIVILRKNQLFEGLQINELMHLARITVKIDIPENQLIINEGGMGDELFILVEGSVKVYTGNRVLDTLGPGSCIGELSIIDEEPRSANVKTISHAKILSIKRRDFLLTLKENPSMSIKTMQVITHRLRKLIVQQD